MVTNRCLLYKVDYCYSQRSGVEVAMLLWGSFFDSGVVIDCAVCSYCIDDITMSIALKHSLPVDSGSSVLSILNTASTLAKMKAVPV